MLGPKDILLQGHPFYVFVVQVKQQVQTHLLLEFIFSSSNLCNESQYPVLTFVFLAKYGNSVHDFEFCLPCLLNTRKFYMRTLFCPGNGMS